MHLSQLKGFTLVEVLVSATIMTIGLMGVAGLTYISLTYNSVNTDVILSINLAEGLIEELKNLSYTDPDLGHSNFDVTTIDTRDGLNTTERNNLNQVTTRVEEFLNRNGVGGPTSDPMNKFTRYYFVCDSENANIATHCPAYGLANGENIKYIEVSVFYKEKSGKMRKSTLSTLISRW